MIQQAFKLGCPPIASQLGGDSTSFPSPRSTILDRVKMVVGGDVKSHDSNFLRARIKLQLNASIRKRLCTPLASTPLTYTPPAYSSR